MQAKLEVVREKLQGAVAAPQDSKWAEKLFRDYDEDVQGLLEKQDFLAAAGPPGPPPLTAFLTFISRQIYIFEVINPHTVGSLTIPRASIKWV